MRTPPPFTWCGRKCDMEMISHCLLVSSTLSHRGPSFSESNHCASASEPLELPPGEAHEGRGGCASLSLRTCLSGNYCSMKQSRACIRSHLERLAASCRLRSQPRSRCSAPARHRCQAPCPSWHGAMKRGAQSNTCPAGVGRCGFRVYCRWSTRHAAFPESW